MSDKTEIYLMALSAYNQAQDRVRDYATQLHQLAERIHNPLSILPSSTLNWPTHDEVQSKLALAHDAHAKMRVAWGALSPEVRSALKFPPGF